MIPRRQLAWTLAALVVLAVLLAWRTQSGTAHEILTAGLIIGALQYATPLAYAAIGGLFSERSGIVNIGLEGMMLAGAFFGVLAGEKTGSWPLGVLAAAAAGGALGLIHAVLSIHLHADQVISGIGINILALGITSYSLNAIYGIQGIQGTVPRIPVVMHFLGSVPLAGGVLGSLNLMIWLLFVLVAGSWFYLFRTPWGLRLRSAGEHPRAAETVGIDVYRVRYAAVTFSGVLSGLGGAYLAFGLLAIFTDGMTAGRGFIALAALIFGRWRPVGVLAATLLFGFSQALGDALQVTNGVSADLVSMLPYALTLLALVGLVGRSIGPAAAGQSYSRQ